MQKVNVRDKPAVFSDHWSPKVVVPLPWHLPKDVVEMLPLYRESHFTFRFGDDRIIPRFHLEGVEAGRHVSVFRIDPDTGERLGLLTTGVAGDGGWVAVKEPILVRGGEAFVAVPKEVDA